MRTETKGMVYKHWSLAGFSHEAGGQFWNCSAGAVGGAIRRWGQILTRGPGSFRCSRKEGVHLPWVLDLDGRCQCELRVPSADTGVEMQGCGCGDVEMRMTPRTTTGTPGTQIWVSNTTLQSKELQLEKWQALGPGDTRGPRHSTALARGTAETEGMEACGRGRKGASRKHQR